MRGVVLDAVVRRERNRHQSDSYREEAIEETAVEYSTFVKLAAEFFGTAILMIFGNGAVANVN